MPHAVGEEVCPEVVDRGARDPAGVFSRLIDRRPRGRGRKEAASMLKVAGDEGGDEALDGRSLLDEIAREGARRISRRRWTPLAHTSSFLLTTSRTDGPLTVLSATGREACEWHPTEPRNIVRMGCVQWMAFRQVRRLKIPWGQPRVGSSRTSGIRETRPARRSGEYSRPPLSNHATGRFANCGHARTCVSASARSPGSLDTSLGNGMDERARRPSQLAPSGRARSAILAAAIVVSS